MGSEAEWAPTVSVPSPFRGSMGTRAGGCEVYLCWPHGHPRRGENPASGCPASAWRPVGFGYACRMSGRCTPKLSQPVKGSATCGPDPHSALQFGSTKPAATVGTLDATGAGQSRARTQATGAGQSRTRTQATGAGQSQTRTQAVFWSPQSHP